MFEQYKEPEKMMIGDFNGLIDIMRTIDGDNVFVRRDGDSLLLIREIKIDGKDCVPPPQSKIPWLLPRYDKFFQHWKKIKSDPKAFVRELYMDLLAFYEEVSELPSKLFYDLFVAWTFHTHLLEEAEYSPIICLFAVAERGKTRTGKAMAYLARHGVVVECLREAYIVRIAESFKAMLFVDVKDISKKLQINNSEDILLYRYERGAKVPRVTDPKLGPINGIDYYSTFGATVIGSNTSPDSILETRCIMNNMRESSKKFEKPITPESCLELREKLLAFRAWYLGEKLPDVAKPADGRLGDILKPILQIIELICPERKPMFSQLVSDLIKSREMEKLESTEARVVRAILSSKDQIRNGALSVKAITDSFNASNRQKFPISYQKMGWLLSSIGLEKCKTHEGGSAILWDEGKILKVSKSYGIDPSTTKTDLSEDRLFHPGVSDDSDDLS